MNTSPLTALLFLALGGFSASLREAFSITGKAGIERLAERYPEASARLARWEPRWPVLTAGLSFLVLCFLVLTVATAWPLFRMAGSGIRLPAAALLLALLLAVFMDILPRVLAESYADRLSLIFLRPASWWALAVWPVAWPLAHAHARLRTLLLSGTDEEDHPSPEDNIRSLVSEPGGTDLEESEREIIRSVFEFGETIAREIMTPRVDIQTLESTDTVDEAVGKIRESPYSRFPVIRETIDDVQGVVHVKDLLHQVALGQGAGHVLALAKPAPFVPEAMPINDLLQLLRAEQAQMAVVVDEYGGTSGLVSVEDIIEELVGEIFDEYDPGQANIHALSDGSALLAAKVLVDDANEKLRIHVPTDSSYDSLGGFVIHHFGRIPRPGETVAGPDFRITVQTADQRRIHTLRVQRIESGEDGGPA